MTSTTTANSRESGLQTGAASSGPSGISPSVSGRASLTRGDIIALGNSGRPWAFLPVAAKALQLAPGDLGILFLAAANLGRVGLRTAALETLDRLPPEVQEHADAMALRDILRRLPEDRVSIEARRACAIGNIGAIGRFNADAADALRGALGAWEERSGSGEVFRSLDGNVMRRARGSRDLIAFQSLSDQRSQARAFAVEQVGTGVLMGKPIVVEGFDPPWVALELLRSTDTTFNGYRRRMTFIQADAVEAVEGLSLADLSSLLSDPRVRVLVGGESSRRLESEMSSRLGTSLVGQYVPLAGLRTRCEPGVVEVLRGVERAQAGEFSANAARIEALYAGRDRAWWSRRFSSPETPLRVLIPTCRFSTFVRYSSEDLARGFESAGCVARVLMEPDDFSSMSAPAYQRAILEFEPDLVVLINYPRASLGSSIHGGIPFVCWVQDAMPHLFDPGLGASQGALDFVVGVRVPELVRRFGYPRDRALAMPVVVSESKFVSSSGGPGVGSAPESGPSVHVGRGETVHLALASHHGEPPDAMHRRLVSDASKDPVLSGAMELLRERAIRMGSEILRPSQKDAMRASIMDAVRRIGGGDASERLISVLTHSYFIPMADRALRHETVEWAAEIARRRGWRFRLYGKNWEKHERFGEFAAGSLDHGDALRESYARASVHLHASYHGGVHQRVMECALAGGLPVSRLAWPTLSPLMIRAKWAVYRRLTEGGASAVELSRVRVGDHEELREVGALIGEMGLRVEGGWGDDDRVPCVFDASHVPDIEEETWELVRPIAALSFRDAEGLERLVERASEDSAWRASASEGIASVVRGRLTHGALARRLIGHVARGLVDVG